MLTFAQNRKMRRAHYLSGIIITLFTGLHLFNHVCSLFGAETHIETMQVLRHFYRNPFIEIILLFAVIVQIISGLKLYKISRKSAVSRFDKLHIWSGLYLAIFFIFHVSAVMIGRVVLHLDTNFYFGVAGLNTFPFNLFFIPYYTLAIISFFGHIAAIHNRKMKTTLLNLTPGQQAKAILIFGFVLTVIIFYGLTNRFQGVVVPSEYNILIGK
jgi:hypothetical protein